MILGLLSFFRGDNKSRGEKSTVPTRGSSEPVNPAAADEATAKHGRVSLGTAKEEDTSDLNDFLKIGESGLGETTSDSLSGSAIRVDLEDEETSDVVSVHFDTFVNAEEVWVRTTDSAPRPESPQEIRVKGPAKDRSKTDNPPEFPEPPEPPTPATSPVAMARPVGYATYEGETAKLGTEELALLVSQFSNTSANAARAKRREKSKNDYDADISSEVHFETGFEQWQQGCVEEALHYFALAVESGNKQALGYMMIGLCYLNQENIWEAIKHFKFGLHGEEITAEETKALYFEIGRSYEKLNDENEANYYYAKIARLDSAFRNDSTRYDYGDNLRKRVIGARKLDNTLVDRKLQKGLRKKKKSKKPSGIRAYLQKLGF